MNHLALDSHSHCGYTVPFEELAGEWREGAIDGGVVFSPVEEIYDRYDPFFSDTPEYHVSRSRVHGYLLDLATRRYIYPYFFVWNDFAPVPAGFVGIKWHRHAGEPVYRYESPRCEARIEEICSKKLPIVLEEEFAHTLQFLDRIAGKTVIIIPHMGGLNGGYERLRNAGVFEQANVWVDTALAHPDEIADFASRYGIDRIMFGSDYPFGRPRSERRKVESLFAGEERAAVCSGNLMRLLAKSVDDARESW